MRLAIQTAAAAVFILSSACSLIGQGGPTASALHIGVDLPLTGPGGRAAVPALNGIRFYVQQHPTIDGFTVSLSVADDGAGGQPNALRGAANVQAFLSDPNLVAMIGPFSSGVARKEIPVANAAQLAMVSPATSSPCLTKDVLLPSLLTPNRGQISCKDAGLPAASELRPTHINNFFRLTATDELQGPAAADYVYKTLHMFRVAVISDHEVYGQSLAEAFTARLQRLGGTVVGHLDLDPKTSADATAFLTSMKAAGAQAVYFGGVTRSHGCLIRAQMKSVFEPGEATPYLGADGIAADPACVRDAAANFTGIYATVPVIDADARAAAAPTIKAFKAAFGAATDYGPYTIVAYDATAILYAALDRAIRASGGQLPARGNVISQLSVTSGFAGVTGTIGFDPAGDTTNRIVSILEPASSEPRTPWKLVDSIDYSTTLPY